MRLRDDCPPAPCELDPASPSLPRVGGSIATSASAPVLVASPAAFEETALPRSRLVGADHGAFAVGHTGSASPHRSPVARGAAGRDGHSRKASRDEFGGAAARDGHSRKASRDEFGGAAVRDGHSRKASRDEFGSAPGRDGHSRKASRDEFGSAAGRDGNERRASRDECSAEDLQKLPIAEAVRHVLIQRAGSLRQAYLVLDVKRTGKVNSVDFERGLANLNICSCPHDRFLTIQSLFEALSGGAPVLSLQELLGYVPIDRRAKMQNGSDTHALWFQYHNKTSEMKSRLVRQPAWRPDWQSNNALPPIGEQDSRRLGDDGASRSHSSSRWPPSWEEAESARRRRRQELRNQFRDARCDLAMEEKRDLVGGLVPSEDAFDHCVSEHRRVERQKQRIQGAIKDCSRSRHQLMDMQKKLSQLSHHARKPDVDNELKNGIKLALWDALPRIGLSPTAKPRGGGGFQASPQTRARVSLRRSGSLPVIAASNMKRTRIDDAFR